MFYPSEFRGIKFFEILSKKYRPNQKYLRHIVESTRKIMYHGIGGFGYEKRKRQNRIIRRAI